MITVAPFPVISQPIGFYPLVATAAEVERLAQLGCSTIQLRIKDATPTLVEEQVATAVANAKAHKVRLFINDYWQLALQYQAYGVHLGQEDLDSADIAALRMANLHLGISCHSYWEVARAHAVRPSYIAFGPIFATSSKNVNFLPQGLAQLRYWCELLQYPVVAIGGITSERLPAVQACGVSGYASVAAIDEIAKNFMLNNSAD